nr:hypothetical protein [Candidatus Sigynarchaeota archaeon]
MLGGNGVKVGSDRIIAIDYLKGIAVIWFTLGHMMLYWQDGSWRTIVATCIIGLDWLTVNFFVAITVVGTMMSIYKKQETGKNKGMFISALEKSSFLLIVGEVLNVVIDLSNNYNWGVFHLFGANMISVIALAQLLTFGLVKISIRKKIVLLTLLSILYFILLKFSLDWLRYDGSGDLPVFGSDLTDPAYIFYFLLFFMDAMAPTMTWIIVAVLASIVFEHFSKLQASQDINGDFLGQRTKPNTDVESFRRDLIVSGLVAIIIGVLAGGFILFRGIGPSADEYDYLVNDDPFRYYFLEGLPLIFIRHFPQYVFFNVGVLAIVFSAFVHHETISKKRFPLQKTIARAGRYSLTIFVAQHVLALIPLKISLVWYIVFAIPVILVVLIGIREWETRAKGKGTLEWFLSIYTYKISRLKLKRQEMRIARENNHVQ